MIVNIEHTELSFLYSIASIRYHEMILNDPNKSAKKYTDKSIIDIIIDGVISEYAYCKHFNLFFNLADSNKYDILHKESYVDIKSTRYKKGRLLTPIKEYPNTDYFVLAVISNLSVEFVGYIHKSNFIAEENIKELIPNKPGYCVERDKLTKFK